VGVGDGVLDVPFGSRQCKIGRRDVEDAVPYNTKEPPGGVALLVVLVRDVFRDVFQLAVQGPTYFVKRFCLCTHI